MNWVGIDLGTTNSAIASYDGEQVTLYKSPDDRDVTPSVIYVDKRGNRYYGDRAYKNAAQDRKNAAQWFKRQIGSSTPFALPNADQTLSAEECSSEILRVLNGYLPPAFSRSPEVGTVITVPAAFDQAQKNATLAAAEAAHIGNVALLQEPVAAVMSVMRKRRTDGIFLIFDLGGGTFDVAVAQSLAGHVNLLGQGGIPVCGGRDMDKLIVEAVVTPWLRANFTGLSELGRDRSERLGGLVAWASEQAKIALSQRESTRVSLTDQDLQQVDAAGRDIFVDVPINRQTFDSLIASQLEETIVESRRVLEHASLAPSDVERIIFIGGPTRYGPLRAQVARELGIAESTEVDPMTAVAEGAAIFAESIDWAAQSRGRKSSRGSLRLSESDVRFEFSSRTPSGIARIVVSTPGVIPAGAEFQIDSLDTGWSSGRIPLRADASVEVALAKGGENRFKVSVFDPSGAAVELTQNTLVIARTAAVIDGIPASHSIGIEVNEGIRGVSRLAYLVKEGQPLPATGVLELKALKRLSPDGVGSINIKIWQGEFMDSVNDNTYIGSLVISSHDISGEIPIGTPITCNYDINDSGAIELRVSVPSIESIFKSNGNLYSSQDAKVNFADAGERLNASLSQLRTGLDRMSGRVSEDDLASARSQLEMASSQTVNDDPDQAKRIFHLIDKVRASLARARRKNLPTAREADFEACCFCFNRDARPHAKPAEAEAFDRLARATEKLIGTHGSEFEESLNEMWFRRSAIVWRRDDWVAGLFETYGKTRHSFHMAPEVEGLFAAGNQALSGKDFAKLRRVVSELYSYRITGVDDSEMALDANIVLAE